MNSNEVIFAPGDGATIPVKYVAMEISGRHATKGHHMKLITLQASPGEEIFVCRACDAKMNAGKIVMRDHNGQHYCLTVRGLTSYRDAHCDCCAGLRDGSVAERKDK